MWIVEIPCDSLMNMRIKQNNIYLVLVVLLVFSSVAFMQIKSTQLSPPPGFTVQRGSAPNPQNAGNNSAPEDADRMLQPQNSRVRFFGRKAIWTEQSAHTAKPCS